MNEWGYGKLVYVCKDVIINTQINEYLIDCMTQLRELKNNCMNEWIISVWKRIKTRSQVNQWMTLYSNISQWGVAVAQQVEQVD